MLRLTLAQMRRSLGRLVSAGIAIAIGTAFVAATLLVGNVITRTTYDSIAAAYAEADLVVSGRALTSDVVTRVTSTPGVATTSLRPSSGLQLTAGGREAYVAITEATTEPRLEAQKLVSGSFPTTAGEIAVPQKVAERLRVAVGGTVDTTHYVEAPSAPSDSSTTGSSGARNWVEKHDTVTIVGLVDDPAGAFSTTGGAAVLSVDQAESVARDQAGAAPMTYDSLILTVAPGTAVSTVQQTLASAVPTGISVNTKDDQAKASVASATGDTQSITAVVLGFAAIALVVAALVISNTFQVIIAQRTRTLALLRCVGADKGQLRRSVLIEALILGLTSSAVGLLTGIAVVQVTLQILQRTNVSAHLPSSAGLSLVAVLVPLVIGTVVTLVASLAPARAATRVAPLAALRPAEAPRLTGTASRARLVIAALLTVGGTALLVLAIVLAPRVDSLAALGLGVLGGAISFVGVLIGAVLWIPQVVGGVGRLVARAGTSSKLAVANTVRNPRRTAATSTALLIGVTLVTMMSAGAVSARATLGGKLDQTYPVDVSISSIATSDGAAPALPPGVASTVAKVAGVRTVVPVSEARLMVSPTTGGSDSGTADGVLSTVHGISVTDAGSVVRNTGSVAALDDRTLVVSPDTAKDLGLHDASTVRLTAPGTDGQVQAGAPSATLTVVVSTLHGEEALVTPTTMAAVTKDAPTSLLWAQIDDVNTAADTVPSIQDALTDQSVSLTGGAVERASLQSVIDTMLMVVVGLLGVAVVIALVGVANTLSLSVMERQRESATLRAIGLKRSQLQVMLAIEGMLIAGVGAVLGIGLGLLYGWAGAATTLGTIGTVQLEVPWRDLGLVVVVALVAGFLASVVPGRAAARTSPVAALAVE